MTDLAPHNFTGEIAFSSSVKDCRWHGLEGAHAFERWHFDALSDDGREALVITFHDNCAISPRYFRNGSKNGNSNGNSKVGAQKFPAVSLIYTVDGKTVLRTVNEFSDEQFSAEGEGIRCSIGNSSFQVNTASYGSGFVLHIDLLTSRKRRITAEMEWLSIEADLFEAEAEKTVGSDACWNIASPRSDVSGRLTLFGQQGTTRRLIHFRGTGYHDHFRSGRSLTDTIGARYWGRAHFIDSTAIFHCHDLGGELHPRIKLILIHDGAIHQREISNVEDDFIRTRHGFRVPELLSFVSDDDIRLRIKPVKVFQTGFFESRILSEMTLSLRDGKVRETFGITELLTPKLMRSRFFRWLTDLRIGKNGKGPIY
ncbi:MAG: hypothetical protein IPL32_16100 [Chloracidobacterium sp.]|nr:hypothetical protein [Chloracidobacterium sp.]